MKTTTMKKNRREADVELSLYKAMDLDLPEDFQEALEVLRKQTPIIRYVRMGAVFGRMLLEMKEMRPNDVELETIYQKSVSSASNNLKHYINTGDLIGLNQVIERVEEQLIEVFAHQVSKSK